MSKFLLSLNKVSTYFVFTLLLGINLITEIWAMNGSTLVIVLVMIIWPYITNLYQNTQRITSNKIYNSIMILINILFIYISCKTISIYYLYDFGTSDNHAVMYFSNKEVVLMAISIVILFLNKKFLNETNSIQKDHLNYLFFVVMAIYYTFTNDFYNYVVAQGLVLFLILTVIFYNSLEKDIKKVDLFILVLSLVSSNFYITALIIFKYLSYLKDVLK